MHQLKAAELTEEEYQKIYDDYINQYDVISSGDRPLSIEEDSAG